MASTSTSRNTTDTLAESHPSSTELTSSAPYSTVSSDAALAANTEKLDHANGFSTQPASAAHPTVAANGLLTAPNVAPIADPEAPGASEAAQNGSAAGSAAGSRPASVRPPSAIHAPTQVTYDPDFPLPPPLNYTLRTRMKWILIFWGFVVVDVIFMPIALYFGLWYGTSLSHNAVFSISTGLLGTVSIVEYFVRFHRLWKKGSTCRVIGAKRFYLDFFHWNISLGWIAVMIELIVGTVPEEPPIRLLAMPVASMIFAFGVEMLIVDIARYFNVKAPVRISSLPRGSPLRPGIYSIIEDICAVDGSGGTEFRQRLNLRYQASKDFRFMLHRLTLFWAFGACAAAVLTTVLIFVIDSKDAAYVIGWVVPFIWAGIWAAITTVWVQKSLKYEYANWHEAKWKA